MSKTIWQGTISFGLVEIQVGLYPAERSHDLGLKMLDRKDFSPIGYKRYNKTTQKEIEWDDIVRGYEYAKGEYVVLSDEELRRANPAVTQMVRILYFVDAKDIDPIYYEKPYYLAPLSKKSRGYALLRDTLKRTNTLGIARIAVHTREYIAAVGERDHAIVLYLLRFEDEIRSTEDLEGIREPVRLDAKEIEMAEKLLGGMKQKWQPEKLKDEYANDVKKLVEKKVKSGKIHVLPDSSEDEVAAPRQAKIIDLMPLLKKSIESTRRAEGSRPATGRTSTKRPTRTTRSVRVRHSA